MQPFRTVSGYRNCRAEAIGSRRKPSGRKRAAVAWRTPSMHGVTSRLKRSNIFAAGGKVRGRLANGARTGTVYSTWVTMCTSGAPTGTRRIITRHHLIVIRPDLKLEHAAYRAAAPGGTRSKPLARLTEAVCLRLTHTLITDFGWFVVRRKFVLTASPPGARDNLGVREPCRHECEPEASDNGRRRDVMDKNPVCTGSEVHLRSYPGPSRFVRPD